MLTTTTTTTSKSIKQVMKKPNTTKKGGPNPKSKPKKSCNTATTSSKHQPLKVVYISNPMRIEATAAEFRALVQELTGRDAADWPSPITPPNLPRIVPQSIENDIHVPVAVVDDDDQLTRNCFGADLGCFGPFDCDDDLLDQDDRTVVMDEIESFYGFLQQ